MESRLGLICWFALACSDPTAPVAIRATEPMPVGEPGEPAPAHAEPRFDHGATNHLGARVDDRPHVDELVFGPSRAAYDLSGWSPRAIERHRPEESFTASDYHFHYADIPGHPGVRAATNRVTLTLESGAGRELVLGIVEAERAEIAGQVPSAGFYQLRLPTTTFEEGMAATARIRATPGVRVAAYSPSSYFEAE